MAILLLLVIYIAFIGLGIPDSLFGTAWPAKSSDILCKFCHYHYFLRDDCFQYVQR